MRKTTSILNREAHLEAEYAASIHDVWQSAHWHNIQFAQLTVSQTANMKHMHFHEAPGWNFIQKSNP